MNKINFDKLKKERSKKENSSVAKKRIMKARKESQPKKTRKFRIRIFYWLCILVVLGALAAFIGGLGFCYYIVKSAPEYNIDKMFEKEPSRIFDSGGKLIATLGAEQREKVTYDELPQVLVDAIIATEDSRFFQHNGFDAPRFIKASISQVMGQGGGGASTLTMQLSKLAFTDTNTEGFAGIVRKFTDIYMAVFKMERNLTKEEIIEYYVNNPCLGGNIYGVQQASKYYFNKNVKDLNLVEAAQIAGMFQSPNGYNPYINPNDANDRKNEVLYLMKRHGYITDAEYKAATSVEIKDFLSTGTTSVNVYQGFIDTVVQEIIDDTGNNPYDVPMDIYSTMVRSKQDIVNSFYKTWDFRDSKIDVGIALLNNKTGEIMAVGAGRNKKGAMTLNIATFDGMIKRMPGSTAKPILDYGPAIEYTNVGTYGPFIDDRVPYAGSVMKNSTGGYGGFMSLRDCLRNSVNTCALQAYRLTTPEQKRDFAEKLGMDFGDNELNESYAIGTWNGVSPVSLANAYSAFGNNGYRVTSHSYKRLVYRDTDEEVKPIVKTIQCMKPTTAYLIANILTGNASRVSVSGTNVATKTGTSSYDTSILRKYGLSSSVIPDSWVSTFSPDYALAFWYGYPDGLNDYNVKHKHYITMSQAGSDRQRMIGWLANRIYEKNSKFKNPGGITSARVEWETIPAQSPSKYTPSSLVRSFLFVGNTGPSETSPRFAQLTDPLSATYTQDTNAVKLSWTSPGLPSAVDPTYLANYFKNNWKIQPEKYLNKRLSYNASNIGDFGFAIYLTSGSNSTYVGWTKGTEYTINLSRFTGVYDGVIIKSQYSKFKSNASNGYRLSFTIKPDKVDENDINVSMSGLSQTLSVGSVFKELNTSNVTSITYKGTEIRSSVKNLNVVTSSITNDIGEPVTPDKITENPGTYNVVYNISFNYINTAINKTATQTIIVQ